MKRKKVYIAGPYTKGDVALNVHAALEAAEKVVAVGGIPFVPHLTHFWHLIFPHPYRMWLAYDAEWLLACDVVLRLPGESAGADEEVALAQKLGVPVCCTFGEVEDFIRGK